jgi:Methyltransferase domain
LIGARITTTVDEPYEVTQGMVDFRSRVSYLHLEFLRRVGGTKPIPLWYWSFCLRLAGIFSSGPDLLFPPYEFLRSSGESLKIEELNTLLMNDTLGEWSLDAQTIVLLWEILHRVKPKLVVECGAGISTLVLARYAALASSEGESCCIVSLEQDFETTQSVRLRLSSVSLDRFVQVVHSPLDANDNYSLHNFEKVLARLPRKCIDFLVIDGPAGAIGCRLETLPMLLGHCLGGAKWFLDDAFRDGEMRILHQWSRLASIEVEGIYPIGKGLGAGSIRHTPRITGH